VIQIIASAVYDSIHSDLPCPIQYYQQFKGLALVCGAFISDDNGPDSHSEWCEEYHPELTYSECADVAGW